ncbi:MAG TPA: L-threonylcarbamoyladenylate synthase [Polyangiaceae bacterium]|nr:L-threonylcarbamoyladenylate synthase [Polyangiaceae bacterium]
MTTVPASDAAIAQAGSVIRRGGLVAFPTETVYGLGADALSAPACARIFEVKGRPRFDPLIVHVADQEGALQVVAGLDARARTLAERFWPGPLTLVLPKTERVSDLVTSGMPTVAVRVPAHPVALALIRAAGRPIAAPSANPFGYVSPTTAAHVEAQLGGAVDVILDGGPCAVGIESTIVDLSTPAAALLREGGTETAAIEAAIGPLARRAGTLPVNAPGQLESHYAPRVPLRLLAARAAPGDGGERRGLLAFAEPRPDVAKRFSVVEVLSPTGNVREAAQRLFACLRRLDDAGLSEVLAEPVPDSGLGPAIRDRLVRASRR